MKKESVEQAAEREFPEIKYSCTSSTIRNFNRKRQDNISAFVKGAKWREEQSGWIDNPTVVNCLHAKCPNCGVDIDITPADGTVILKEDANYDLFRNFIRTNHLTAKWDKYFEDNQI